jgi:hypothetical protein
VLLAQLLVLRIHHSLPRLRLTLRLVVFVLVYLRQRFRRLRVL